MQRSDELQKDARSPRTILRFSRGETGVALLRYAQSLGAEMPDFVTARAYRSGDCPANDWVQLVLTRASSFGGEGPAVVEEMCRSLGEARARINRLEEMLRTSTDVEANVMRLMLRAAAATGFWLSRRVDEILARDGTKTEDGGG